MAKFRAECERTVHTGSVAIRTATLIAYRSLANQIEKTRDRAGVLCTSGMLTSFTCDSNVYIGAYLSASGRFALDVLDGWTFSSGALGEALRLVGEPLEMQAEAEEASRAINALVRSFSTPELNGTGLREVLRGAVGSTNVTY
eukprot:6689202-Prymnesium_polylepis.1